MKTRDESNVRRMRFGFIGVVAGLQALLLSGNLRSCQTMEEMPVERTVVRVRSSIVPWYVTLSQLVVILFGI